MSQADKERFARENHSEIERRRRNKMTSYITELSDMVPSCSALARKPDKLTILRMAVSHMKQLRGVMAGTGLDKPAFLTDQELKHLALESMDGFLFVASCENGRVLYVSDTVTAVLNQAHSDWIGHSLFDLIHPQDVAKVQEQFTIDEPRHPSHALDVKTAFIKKEPSASPPAASSMVDGMRKAFLCRMKCGKAQVSSADPRYQRGHITAIGEELYALMRVTGHIRPWPPTGFNEGQSNILEEMGTPNPMGGEYCLLGIARLYVTSQPTYGDLSPSTEPVEFVTRQSLDNTFTYVDKRITQILGYQPHELIGKSPRDICLPEDLEKLSESFKQVMLMKGQVFSAVCRIQNKNGDYIWVRIGSHAFQNPYNNDVEYIVSNFSLVKQNQGHLSEEQRLAEHKSLPSYREQGYSVSSSTERSPDIQSPSATLNYPPQAIPYASVGHVTQFNPVTGIASNWVAHTEAASDYTQALAERYPGAIATQHGHAAAVFAQPTEVFPVEARPVEPYHGQDSMMIMEQSGSSNSQGEFTELFTPFSGS